MERGRDRLDRDDLAADIDGPKNRRRAAETPEHSSPTDQTAEPSERSVVPQDRAVPAAGTPGSEAQRESEVRAKELLAAYQETLDVMEELPAVVWIRWGGKGLWRYLKVPYLRWFLRYSSPII